MEVLRRPAATRCGGRQAENLLVLAWRPLEQKAPLELATLGSLPAVAPPLELA